MRELFRFLSDFGDSFFRGDQGKLALASLGVAVGLAICTVNSQYNERQVRDLFGAVEVFTALGILLLMIRPRRKSQ